MNIKFQIKHDMYIWYQITTVCAEKPHALMCTTVCLYIIQVYSTIQHMYRTAIFILDHCSWMVTKICDVLWTLWASSIRGEDKLKREEKEKREDGCA